MPTTPKKLFVSYSHEDRDIVRTIISELDKFLPNAIEFLTTTLQRGITIPETIAENLELSDGILVIISNSYQEYSWAGFEIGYFLQRRQQNQDKRIFIAALEIGFTSDAIPLLLRNYPVVSIPTIESANFKQQVEKLARSIEIAFTERQLVSDSKTAASIEQDILKAKAEELEQRALALSRDEEIRSEKIARITATAIGVSGIGAAIAGALATFIKGADLVVVLVPVSLLPIAATVGYLFGQRGRQNGK